MKTKLLILSSLLEISAQANSATTIANFQTSTTLNATCTIVASNVSLGLIALDPINLGKIPKNMYGFIKVFCSKGIDYTIGLSAGNSNDFANRTMAGTNGNTDKLSYNIYIDSREVVWKDQGTPWIDVVTGTGNGAQQTIPYGLAVFPKKQIVKPDIYSDTLTVIMTY